MFSPNWPVMLIAWQKVILESHVTLVKFHWRILGFMNADYFLSVVSSTGGTICLRRLTTGKLTSAVNNTVNKLILDRRSCEKLHKKLGLAARFS